MLMYIFPMKEKKNSNAHREHCAEYGAEFMQI